MKKCIFLYFVLTFISCQIIEEKNKPDDLSLAKWEVYKGLYNFIDKRQYIRCQSRESNHFFMVEQSYRCPELTPHEIYIKNYLLSELLLESQTHKGDTTIFHFSLIYEGKCIIPLCPIDSPNSAGVYKHTVVYIGFGSAIFVDNFDDSSFILHVIENKNVVNEFLFEEARRRHFQQIKKAKPDR